MGKKESERRSKGNAGPCQYSSTETEGEGFGKKRVGMRVKVRFYNYTEDVGFEEKEGIITKITRRINSGYYDYWYKVKLEDGKEVWKSSAIVV